jgi:multidomain signaling protein FimX
MISLLIISDNMTYSHEWISMLKQANLPIDEQTISHQESSEFLKTHPDIDLIIYHADSPRVNESFFNNIENTIINLPVLIACVQDPTEAFRQYRQFGVRDAFLEMDKDRLLLVMQREIEVIENNRQFEELKKLFAQAQSRCKSLLETSEDALAYIQDGMHMQINPAYMAVFSYVDEDDLTAKPIMDLISSEYHTYFKQFLKSAGQLTQEQRIELECVRSDGQTFQAAMIFSPAVYDGENCLQLQVQNLELEQKVNIVSDKDPQTGLYSRHHFMQDLQLRENSKDPKSPKLTLLYILVDGFEELKNVHGIATSDLILKEIAGIMQTAVKPGITLYRFGDHSFTILVESNDLQKAKYLSENLIRMLGNHEYSMVKDVRPPTLSIGLSTADLKNSSQTELLTNMLLNQAYQSCREIYNNGGNGFLTYESLARHMPEDQISSLDDPLHLKELLNYALEHDRFQLAYQPIVSIQGDTNEHYAVLVRLMDNNNEQISPVHFLKQAAMYGLMSDIDRWVIKNAIDEIAHLRRNGGRINFFIQISESGVRDDTLLLWIVDCIRKSNAKGSWLTFQINYPDITDHMLAVEKLINGLKKINCNIAINQFEQTDHSMQLLKKLPVDVIKLRYTVLESIKSNTEDKQRLIELNRYAYDRQIKIVASRIEQPDILSHLWKIGINYIQGFSLQEPHNQIAEVSN